MTRKVEVFFMTRKTEAFFMTGKTFYSRDYGGFPMTWNDKVSLSFS